MKKRMLSMVLVIVMVMGMLPGTVLATEDAGIASGETVELFDTPGKSALK